MYYNKNKLFFMLKEKWWEGKKKVSVVLGTVLEKLIIILIAFKVTPN